MGSRHKFFFFFFFYKTERDFSFLFLKSDFTLPFLLFFLSSSSYPGFVVLCSSNSSPNSSCSLCVAEVLPVVNLSLAKGEKKRRKKRIRIELLNSFKLLK